MYKMVHFAFTRARGVCVCVCVCVCVKMPFGTAKKQYMGLLASVLVCSFYIPTRKVCYLE